MSFETIKAASDFLKCYADQVAKDLVRTNFETLAQIADLIMKTKQTGNRIYIAGNGGSAATASHMANDLLKGARVLNREGFRAICLNDSSPIVTCLANDFSYEDIYAIQLRTFAQPGDLFIVYSGSGNSPNVVAGSKVAKSMGLTTIAFGGRNGGKLKEICDIMLIAPTDSMEQLEDMHMLYEHAIVSLLQKQLPDRFDFEVRQYPPCHFPFKAAIFDFDGTLSLLREGWQNVMIPYFIEVLTAIPGVSSVEVQTTVHDFVDLLTGKQTIYQCIRLAEEVSRRGGTPLEPLEYKKEYHRRLLERIEFRLDELRSGKANPDDYVVPGARSFLNLLKENGVRLFLASGTDDNYVQEEVELLQLTSYFKDDVYGAQDDYKTFSKALVIKKIIETNHLKDSELIGFGDGFVEIQNVKEVGGYAVGVATNEVDKKGVDLWKRERLINAGADLIIPDFSGSEQLLRFLKRCY
ncbi:MAG: SIS domain-containing protein [Planctomycetia bacterium]|nr:SIS domain-containing protein [Planctomycetia bacterium]